MRFRVRGLVGVGMILLLGASPATTGNDLRLVQAARNRDAKAVRDLLKHHVDVDAAQPDGATALLWAAQWDDLETADLLIRAGANVNAANDFGVTPLSMAATNGSAAMLHKLLEAGAQPNIALPTGETALMTAALTGSLAAVDALLESGAAVNAKEGSQEQTALMWAVSEGHFDVARRLIERGADVNARSTSGFTPLMFAARQGDLTAVKLLLSRGADVHATASDGVSVLHVATVRGHADVARFLLDQGADANASGPGYTPLHWTAGTWESVTTYDYPTESGELSVLSGLPTREAKLGLIEALLDHEANVNARLTKSPPRFGYSAFAIVGYDRVGVGARNPDEGSIAGATPFFLAAMAGDLEVMRLLRARGADPLLGTNDRTTPLMVAAGIATVIAETRVPESKHLEGVTLCLELGDDINAANNAGNTALHATAYAGYPTVAQFLVDRGATLNAKNKLGETPLKVADGYYHNNQIYSNKSTADLLRKLGGVTQ